MRIRTEIELVINCSINCGTVVILALLLAGCRQTTPTNAATLQITLDTATPFTIGETILRVSVKDNQGNPVSTAKIAVQGDMTHAGMKPEFGTATQGQAGLYEVPFNWSMGGDWVLTITATLPDGRASSQRFPVSLK